MLLFALFASVPPSYAQNGFPELQRELDRLYEALLEDPTDQQLNRRFIELAVQLKDYDAAIGAVERLIFYEPQNAQLLIEAARLYLEIESYAAARGYLEEALAVPEAAPTSVEQATALIEQIDRLLAPSPWSVFAQGGFRYQTNANVAPGILGPEDPFPAETVTPDWNVFGLGSVSYANRFENVVYEADLAVYYADQFEVDRLDLGFGEAFVGPRFLLADDRMSVKPYGVVQGILLGDDPYQRALGGGVLVRLNVEEGWYLEPHFEYKDRLYFNSDDYTDAEELSGDLFTYAANGAGEFSPDFSWLTRVGAAENDAVEPHNSYDQYFASLAVRLVFDLAAWENWVLTPFASVSLTDYKAVDPNLVGIIDLLREDFQWSAGANLEVPIIEHFGMGVQVQYTDNQSNLDRFTYDNLQVIMGPLARF